jgi:hypothetical protein
MHRATLEQAAFAGDESAFADLARRYRRDLSGRGPATRQTAGRVAGRAIAESTTFGYSRFPAFGLPSVL